MACLPADKELEESPCGQGGVKQDGSSYRVFLYGLDDEVYEGGQSGALVLHCLQEAELLWFLD